MTTNRKIRNVKITLTNGSSVMVPAELESRFRGLDTYGNLVVGSDDFLYALTPCCNASAKGSIAGDYPATVCRACYYEVDDYYGGPAVVAVARS